MKTLRLILGDQLSHAISSLRDINHEQDIVLMVEVQDETCYVPHHKQKLVFILAAMRHFAAELEKKHVQVDYVELDDPHNTGSFSGELKRAIKHHKVDRVIVTEAGEWRVQQMMEQWQASLAVEVHIRTDDRFLCSREAFATWAAGRKTLRMEFFYRDMRRKTGWLMQGDQPEGGRWNFDSSNRKTLPVGQALPDPIRFQIDATTQKTMALVEDRFADHFGELASFNWGVTRRQALYALRHFIEYALPGFGDYQDAMQINADFVFHSILSPYLNVGLLSIEETCTAALQAYQEKSAPLAAVEGFIRQIIGWREFVRGIYWLKMPDYAQSNFLDAQRTLPGFYWDGNTRMNCLHQVITATHRNAYAHHIQRLMITGNFALLAGISPAEVERWYLLVYADAFEWVELPNTHGMALFADGGLLGSKPYAASGAYINRMSDYCKQCYYKVKLKSGEQACPFNFLYWDFLMRNQDKLARNPRLAMPYKNLARMDQQQRRQMRKEAGKFLDALNP